MQRVTITIEDDMLAAVDALVETRGYAGRSEAVRDFVRRGLSDDAVSYDASATCVASLTFVAEHATRDLPQRIAELQSQHHDFVLTQTQVPLDHDAALHTMVLRGPIGEIQRFADRITTQRGIRHDHLAIIPANIRARSHKHGHESQHHHDHIAT